MHFLQDESLNFSRNVLKLFTICLHTLKQNDWKHFLIKRLKPFFHTVRCVFAFPFLVKQCKQCVILWSPVRGPLLLSFRDQKYPPPLSLRIKELVCLGEQTGLLQSVHGPIMCRQTKAEAASKSLMQNLCSCGCYSGWKNQYCGSDAWRWLSALWLTVKAKRDWGATFTVLEMEWRRVGLIV